MKMTRYGVLEHKGTIHPFIRNSSYNPIAVFLDDGYLLVVIADHSWSRLDPTGYLTVPGDVETAMAWLGALKLRAVELPRSFLAEVAVRAGCGLG